MGRKLRQPGKRASAGRHGPWGSGGGRRSCRPRLRCARPPSCACLHTLGVCAGGRAFSGRGRNPDATPRLRSGSCTPHVAQLALVARPRGGAADATRAERPSPGRIGTAVKTTQASPRGLRVPAVAVARCSSPPLARVGRPAGGVRRSTPAAPPPGARGPLRNQWAPVVGPPGSLGPLTVHEPPPGFWWRSSGVDVHGQHDCSDCPKTGVSRTQHGITRAVDSRSRSGPAGAHGECRGVVRDRARRPSGPLRRGGVER